VDQVQWVVSHSSQIIALITAAVGLIGATLLAPRFIRWCGNRINAELDLAECKRLSEHREALLKDLIEEVELFRQSREYWESNLPHTTQRKTTRRKNSSTPES
jgi:hypothetical protein